MQGKVKIAQILARAGLHLGATTVRLPQDLILGPQVVNHDFLLAMDPAHENDEEQLPRRDDQSAVPQLAPPGSQRSSRKIRRFPPQQADFRRSIGPVFASSLTLNPDCQTTSMSP